MPNNPISKQSSKGVKTVFEFFITSSALILAVLLIRAACRARVSRGGVYALWLAVLIKLLLPLPLIGSAVSVMNLVPDARSLAVENAEYTSEYEPAPQYFSPSPAPSGGYLDVPTTDAASADSLPEPSIQAAAPAELDVRLLLICVWALGSAALAATFTVTNLRFRSRICAARRPFDVPEAAMHGMKTPVFIVPGLSSPCLFGLLRPAIYLTPESVRDSSALRCTLAHELSHRRHLDHVWCALRCVLLAVWWWHPLVWVAAYFSRIDAEFACDESAIRLLGEEKRLEYSRTLVDMAARSGKYSPALLLSSTPMNTGKHSLKKRILAAVKPGMTAAWAAIALLLVMLLCTACTFTGAKSGGFEGYLTVECAVESISSDKGGQTAAMRLNGGDALHSFRLSPDAAADSESVTAAKLEVKIPRIKYLLMKRADRELLENDLCNALESGRLDRYVSVTLFFHSLGEGLFSSVYMPEECLYMNPLSSLYPVPGGPLYCFSSAGMYVYSAEIGIIERCLVDFSAPDSYTTVDPDEWRERFPDPGSDVYDISGFENRREYRLSDSERLYLFDGQLLLARLYEGGEFQYLVRLAPVSDDELLEMRVTETLLAEAWGTDLAHAVPSMISSTLLTGSADSYHHYDFAAEVHDILGVVRDGSTVTVYLNTHEEQFCYDESGEPENVGGSMMPEVLTFERVSGDYHLSEFWIPSDGSDYASSISEKFLKNLQKAAINYESHSDELLQKARLYGQNYDPDRIVRELLFTLSEQPELDRGSDEYRKLLRMDIHTLRACAGHFEKGGQTGQRALVMEMLCRDLLGDEDIKLEAEPQEWYDAFIAYAERTRANSSAEDMAKFSPRTLELLELHEKYSK